MYSGQAIFCRIGFDCAAFEKAFGIVSVLARTVPFLFPRVKMQMAFSGFVENNIKSKWLFKYVLCSLEEWVFTREISCR